jgi:hypothetical protein
MKANDRLYDGDKKNYKHIPSVIVGMKGDGEKIHS